MSDAPNRLGNPNIFHFATSELSQDAMIAWLMECARAESPALREVGAEFIRFLLDRPLEAPNRIERAVIGADGEPRRYDGGGTVSGVSEVKTQWQRVDVYARAEIDGKLVSFVIEDKTHTSEHGGQLKRYRERIAHDEVQEDYLKLIYLKTGMPDKYELIKAAEEYYCHVGVHHLNEFLQGELCKTASSDLLRQYREHIRAQAEKQQAAKAEWDMHYGPVQRKFAEKLKKACTEKANEQAPPRKGKPDVIWPGRSRGGGHWTQYRFFGRYLFWRMDGGYPLRLMADMKPEGSPPSNANIEQYRSQFGDVCKEAGVDVAKFRRRSGREMTIGAIPYPNQQKGKIGKDVDAFLQQVVQVHKGFLAKLRG